jgi:hypothetical protein
LAMHDLERQLAAIFIGGLAGRRAARFPFFD